jgi:hypothetical protein
MSAAMIYEVQAYNLSHASENRIHDDMTAQRFGFTGGLVPGVEVFAYCCHPAVAEWGRAFLRQGEITVGFQKPVYDGRIATITVALRHLMPYRWRIGPLFHRPKRAPRPVMKAWRPGFGLARAPWS